MQGRRLAGAGRPGDQDHAVTVPVHVFVLFQIVRRKTQRFHGQDRRLLVQYPHNDFFAVYGRQRRNPNVDRPVLLRHLEAAVLRRPFFRDIHIADDFDPGNDRTLGVFGKRRHLTQYAVDAKPDAQALFERFEVDVAGAVLDGLADERVHDIDDRRVFGCFELRGEQGLILLQLAHGFFHEIGNRIGLLDRFQDIRFHGHHRFDFTLRDHSQIIDREKVRGIRHCNRQTVAPFPDRNDAMALGQRQGNETGGLLVWRRRREIDQGNPQILHQHFQQDGFRNQSLLDQNATESFAGAFLRRQGDFQLARSYFSCFDQHFSQAFAPLHGGSSIQSPFLRLVSFQQYPPILLFSPYLDRKNRL